MTFCFLEAAGRGLCPAASHTPTPPTSEPLAFPFPARAPSRHIRAQSFHGPCPPADCAPPLPSPGPGLGFLEAPGPSLLPPWPLPPLWAQRPEEPLIRLSSAHKGLGLVTLGHGHPEDPKDHGLVACALWRPDVWRRGRDMVRRLCVTDLSS